jgi:hypothetical protein
MTIRCGCPDESDDLVFGSAHRCEGRAAPNLQRELDRLERAWVMPVADRPYEEMDEDERRGY